VRERLAYALPLVLAVIVPLAGLLLALVRLGAGERRDAGAMLAATVLGAFLWALLLTS